MYHISSDKRSKDSANKLLGALTRLLEKKEFDDVNVSSLCSEAGLSRPTFYRLFDTPSDIIMWFCEKQTEELAKAYKACDKTDKDFPFHFNLRKVLEHPEALELAYRAKRTDIVETAFLTHMDPALSEMRQKNGLDERDIRLGGHIVIAIITSSVFTWLHEGKQEPLDEFYSRIVRFIHGIQ